MKQPGPLAFLSLAALLFVSCADSEDDKPIPIDKTGATVPPKLVGRIASVPADKRFVLIQSYGKWEVSAGTVLTTRGPDERTANLLVTGEALGQYAAADVQSGTLDVGDAVYSRETQKSAVSPVISEPIDSNRTRPF